MADIVIRDFAPGDEAAFRDINLEWVSDGAEAPDLIRGIWSGGPNREANAPAGARRA
jgi:hypothetical protein